MARVLAAPTAAALRTALCPEEAKGDALQLATAEQATDPVVLATASQRLGRLCAGRRREQAEARRWLLPFLAGPQAATAVEAMDGRALASLLDGLAMLGVSWPSSSSPPQPQATEPLSSLPPGSLARAAESALGRLLSAGGDGSHEPSPVLLAPDAARLFPALVKLKLGHG